MPTLIEEFNRTKGERSISRKGENHSGAMVFRGKDLYDLKEFIHNLVPSWIVADDWEAEKQTITESVSPVQLRDMRDGRILISGNTELLDVLRKHLGKFCKLTITYEE